jgi:hypothetical protein
MISVRPEYSLESGCTLQVKRGFAAYTDMAENAQIDPIRECRRRIKHIGRTDALIF